MKNTAIRVTMRRSKLNKNKFEKVTILIVKNHKLIKKKPRSKN